MLATASKDSMVVLWEVARAEMRHAAPLCGHTDSLCSLAWSPDDAHLLTCAHDQLLMLWASASGECLRTSRKHTDSVMACAWLPSGTHFVSASSDKMIVLWALSGDVLHTWSGPRVQDMGIFPSGDALIAISEHEIHMWPITHEAPSAAQAAVQGAAMGAVAIDGVGSATCPEIHVSDISEAVMTEPEPITSLSLSSDGRHLLVNVASEEVHLWDTHERRLLHRYRGHKQGRFVLRSCFGGRDESLVLSGSEDTQIYVWHRYSETLLEVLPGHSGSVNAVTWCPGANVFASASDDHTVRIWCARGAPLEA